MSGIQVAHVAHGSCRAANRHDSSTMLRCGYTAALKGCATGSFGSPEGLRYSLITTIGSTDAARRAGT
jgi:hypothetical protein